MKADTLTFGAIRLNLGARFFFQHFHLCPSCPESTILQLEELKCFSNILHGV